MPQPFSLIFRSPSLVLICGLPGIGKTTLLERTLKNGEHLDLDKYFAEFGFNSFSVDKLFADAKERLQEGKNVVLDTTALRPYFHEFAQAIASEVGTYCHLLVIDGDPETAAARRKKRESLDPSRALPADSAAGYNILWEELMQNLSENKIQGFDSIRVISVPDQAALEEISFHAPAHVRV